MASKSLAQWERLVKWLSTGGFAHCHGSPGAVWDYVYGPAGTLLRNNIKQSWWNKMVITQESTYPVEGHSVQDPVDCFLEVSDLVNQRLPFSLSQEVTTKQKDIEENHKDKVLFNQNGKTVWSSGHTEWNRVKQLHTSKQTHFKFVHFCLPSVSNQSYDQLINTRLRWWKQYAGNPSSIELTAFDSEDDSIVNGSNIQFEFPWGLETIETVLNRGDKLLRELEENTGKSYQCCNGKKLVYPYQVECFSTLEKAMAVFLIDAYTEKLTKGKKKEPREILQLHPGLAPFKVSVIASGITKSRELQEVATYISRELRASGIKLLDTKDTSGTLEKHLTRNDKLGVPFTAIVKESTLETGAIALRNRDTTVQETLAINKLLDYVQKHVTS